MSPQCSASSHAIDININRYVLGVYVPYDGVHDHGSRAVTHAAVTIHTYRSALA
jgi:hypothetical protein